MKIRLSFALKALAFFMLKNKNLKKIITSIEIFKLCKFLFLRSIKVFFITFIKDNIFKYRINIMSTYLGLKY